MPPECMAATCAEADNCTLSPACVFPDELLDTFPEFCNP